MDKFGKAQPVRRVEDLRFLTGQGRYIDDIAPETALYAYFFRSPVAQARIDRLDTEPAREAPGVHLVLTLDDLRAGLAKTDIGAVRMPNRDGTVAPDVKRHVLADRRVRFVGEAIACIVADTLDQAMDAAELIEFDFQELPAHVALAPGGETLHDEVPGNIAFDWAIGNEEATAEAFRQAAHRVSFEAVDNRIIVNSLEPRGCYAEWERGRLHLACNGQGVWDMKARLVRAFGLEEKQVRVSNPDVGGAFGMKALPYPEYFVIPEAASRLGRPVRWMSGRTEAMQTDNAGRDLISLAEMALDSDFRITGYRVNTICNLGAYSSGFAQAIQTDLFHKVMSGAYDIANIFLAVKGIYTNTGCVDAYRGAGRPEAIYVLERTVDHAARTLGIDRLELRKRNFVSSEKFPYRAATGELIDVGDFHKVLDRAIAEADIAGFEKRRAGSERAGKLRGLGLCYYIEAILGAPDENVAIEFTERDNVNLYVGTQSAGQGHETVFTQFLSNQTGIPAERITVVQGDSDRIPKGGGTGGSRSATSQNNATLAASSELIRKYAAFLASELGVGTEAVTHDDEKFRIEGSNLAPDVLEVARMAREAGREDLLRIKKSATLPGRSYPNGAHFAEVEIDPETGDTQVVKYTVVDDFGNLINPLLVEGQIHGGVAQGLGQMICEHVVHDGDGQLQSATFMDYALPRASDVPWISFVSEPVVSTANELGMKGCGEAGTVGALAAVANAVEDALARRGLVGVQPPFTPLRVWNLLNEVNNEAE